jgi:hypothetical protein
VSAHVALFIWAVVWNLLSGPSQTWADQAVIGGIISSQLGLLSVWAGLGRGRSRPRLARVAVLGFAVVCIPQASRTGVAGWTTFPELLVLAPFAILMILMMMFPVVLLLAVVRRLGWRLERFSEAPPAGAPLQFSVWHLLALSAVAAGLLSAAYYVRPLARFEEHALVSPAGISAAKLVVVPGVVLLSFVAAPLLSVWACLGVGRPGLRLLVAAFFSLALGSLPGYCFGGDLADYALFAGVAVLQLAIVAASLLVFRAVGYRLVRPEDRPQPVLGQAQSSHVEEFHP